MEELTHISRGTRVDPNLCTANRAAQLYPHFMGVPLSGVPAREVPCKGPHTVLVGHSPDGAQSQGRWRLGNNMNFSLSPRRTTLREYPQLFFRFLTKCKPILSIRGLHSVFSHLSLRQSSRVHFLSLGYEMVTTY